MALEWLQRNNPKYYGDIVIDDTHVQALPEDDIPIELLSIIRQSTNMEAVVQESAGYVEQDEEIDTDRHHLDDIGEFIFIFIF